MSDLTKGAVMYEHHFGIKKNKLCPFKLGEANDVQQNIVCNWHTNIEIMLVTEGRGMMQYGKDVFDISSHDIVIINSEVLHRPFGEGKMNFSYIIIDEAFCCENGIDTSALRFKELLRDSVTEELVLRAAEQIKSCAVSNDPIAVARLRAAMLELLIDICSRHAVSADRKEEKSTTSERYVKMALDELNTNFSHPVSLESLADMCGITKYYLAREFKKYTGMTVFTYTNSLRCKKAEMLLAEGRTVTEAALESGFESLSYFSRTYKKLIGVSPSKNK